MNRTLKRLFDYQRFENDSRLGGMIRETETRYGLRGGMQELSDDDLMFLNAAGVPEISGLDDDADQ
ncbi:MAG: hypothetical protein UIB39_08370 [Lachnospiraceae bacterium]|nr:hypothetical protein [Lachnospiraceae bacterium]